MSTACGCFGTPICVPPVEPAATTYTNLFVVPDGKIYTVDAIFLRNTAGGYGLVVNLYKRVRGGGGAYLQFSPVDMAIAALATDSVTGPYQFAPGDELHAYADAVGLYVLAQGVSERPI